MLKKKAQIDIFDVLAGLIVIAGGVLITFSKVNIGSLFASLGLVFEIIKIVLEKGA